MSSDEEKGAATRGRSDTDDLGDYARISKLRFDLATADMYSDMTAQTHELGEQYSIEGVASADKFMRRTAELVVNRFKSLQKAFEEAYIKPLEATLEGMTQARRVWLTNETQPFVQEQVRRAQVVLEGTCGRFGTPHEYRKYVAQLQGEGDALRRRLESAITLAALTAHSPSVNPVVQSDSRSTLGAPQKDDLLPLFRRKDFDDQLNALTTSATAEEPLSLIMIDIDHFKKVNDTHGHPTADEVLVACADVVARRCKGKGTAYRFGGEEIAVLLSNFTTTEATVLAELIREDIERTKMGSKQLAITASFGVASFPQHASTAKQLLENADKALYGAKNLGRNLVRLAGESSERPKLHTPDRRMPQPGGFDDPEVIRALHFAGRAPKCPVDGAVLRIREDGKIGQRTPTLYVSCPFCGLSDVISGPK